MMRAVQVDLDPFASLKKSIKDYDATLAEGRAQMLYASGDVGKFFAAIKIASAEAAKAYTEQKLQADELAATSRLPEVPAGIPVDRVHSGWARDEVKLYKHRKRA